MVCRSVKRTYISSIYLIKLFNDKFKKKERVEQIFIFNCQLPRLPFPVYASYFPFFACDPCFAQCRTDATHLFAYNANSITAKTEKQQREKGNGGEREEKTLVT